MFSDATRLGLCREFQIDNRANLRQASWIVVKKQIGIRFIIRLTYLHLTLQKHSTASFERLFIRYLRAIRFINVVPYQYQVHPFHINHAHRLALMHRCKCASVDWSAIFQVAVVHSTLTLNPWAAIIRPITGNRYILFNPTIKISSKKVNWRSNRQIISRVHFKCAFVSTILCGVCLHFWRKPSYESHSIVTIRNRAQPSITAWTKPNDCFDSLFPFPFK